MEIFARKRAILTQIFFDFEAPRSQNSASMRRVRCATRMASVQLSAESALHLAPRLREYGVRNQAKFREKTRECVANFVRILCAPHAKLGRRALRKLRNNNDVGKAVG